MTSFPRTRRRPQTWDIRRQSQIGDIRRQSQIGDVRRQSQTGDIRRQSQTGDIRRQSQTGDIRRQSQTGDVRRQSQTGDIRRQSQTGDIRRKSQIESDTVPIPMRYGRASMGSLALREMYSNPSREIYPRTYPSVGVIPYEADIPQYEEDMSLYEEDMPQYEEDMSLYEGDVYEYGRGRSPYVRENVGYIRKSMPREEIPPYYEERVPYEEMGIYDERPMYEEMGIYDEIPMYEEIPSYYEEGLPYEENMYQYADDMRRYQENMHQYAEEVYPRAYIPGEIGEDMYSEMREMDRDVYSRGGDSLYNDMDPELLPIPYENEAMRRRVPTTKIRRLPTPVHRLRSSSNSVLSTPDNSSSLSLINEVINAGVKPKKGKCIVLDLDETLVHTENNDGEMKAILSNPDYEGIKDRVYKLEFESASNSGNTVMWGVKRPHLDEFIKFCFDYFEIVAIWSAGHRKYVDAVVANIFSPDQLPHLVYCHDHVSRTSDGDYHKPLTTMISDPDTLELMSESNTYFVDDRRANFREIGKGNAIVVPPYSPGTADAAANDDDILPKIMKWLVTAPVPESDDVRDLDKDDIFA